MNGKSANGSLGGMACIEGLPPLPKSLSGLLNSSGGSWREMERMYVKKTMIQDDLSRGRNNTDNLLANKPANLDAALALLRKEMVTFQGVFIVCPTAGKSVFTPGYARSCPATLPKGAPVVWSFPSFVQTMAHVHPKLRLFTNDYNLLINSAYTLFTTHHII